MSERVRDYLIIIGHTWICTSCRETLLTHPESILVGHKLTEEEREHLMTLTEDSYQTMMELDEATGLTMEELQLAIDHPRSRLRHLGVNRRGVRR
jgi:hypothetical protein